jgi:hypothetical protein
MQTAPAYMGWGKRNEPTKIRIVPATGGQPPGACAIPALAGRAKGASGGAELIFGENGADFPIAASCQLHVFAFKSGKTANLCFTTGARQR